MAVEHQSFFSYNQTRPYPFKWFTPLVITILIIATALFSFLNFITTGYNLISEVSTDPNSTFTKDKWVQGLPSYLSDKLKSTCQPALLHGHDVVATNKSALTYTITGISLQGGEEILSSTEYHSNALTNCSISSVDIHLQSYDRAMNQIAFSRWGATVRTFMQCSFINPHGHVLLNMTNEYNYEPPEITLSRMGSFFGSGFLTRNQTTKPALWWGESLMSWYWQQLSYQMEAIENEYLSTSKTDDEYAIRKGFLSFSRNSPSDDVTTSLDYFTLDRRFLDDKDPTRLTPCCDFATVADLDSQAVFPNIWIPADTLAKSAYWTIMTDLGQTSEPSNILTSQQLLSYFSSNFTIIPVAGGVVNAPPGPEREPLDISDPAFTEAKLAFQPSVISTSYLCQIPRVKSAGNLLISIIVADLVFLQALWMILVLIVDTFWLRPASATGSAQSPESDGLKSYARLRSPSGDVNEMNVLLSPSKGTTAAVREFGGYQGARRPAYRRESSSSNYLLGSPS